LFRKERGTLLERSIVAFRVVKEAIRIFGACTEVPITNELLQAVKLALQIVLYFLRRNASKHYLKRRKGKRVSRLKKHKELQRKPRMI